MALPSARRPQILQEELEERIKEQELAKLVLKVAPVNTFEMNLANWFKRQGKQRKYSMTPKDLKRQAVRICATMNLVYFDLPAGWVERFTKENGVRLVTEKKRKRKKDKTPRPNKRPRLRWNGINGLISNGHSSLEHDLMLSASEDEVEQELPGRLRESSGSGRSSSSTETLVQSALSPVESPSPFKIPKGKRKKFLDLTGDTPPPTWMSVYALGIVLPRVLTIYSTEDTNILYYDYSPKLKGDSGKEVKLGPQPRHQVQLADVLKLLVHDE